MMMPPDLTLDELLSDPLVRSLMRADGVDAQALARDLRAVAPRRTPPGRNEAAWRGLRAVAQDCIQFKAARADAADALRRAAPAKADRPW
ncbi:hypothetical protein [Alsobacter sp. SYSU BS001988]|jgi:hypothetical protein